MDAVTRSGPRKMTNLVSAEEDKVKSVGVDVVSNTRRFRSRKLMTVALSVNFPVVELVTGATLSSHISSRVTFVEHH